MIFVLLVAGLDQGSDARAQSTGTIKGEILSAGTGHPVIGASILLEGTNAGVSADDNGTFQLDQIPAGTYTVRVRSVGYASATRTGVVVRPARITFVTIRLMPVPVDIGERLVQPGPDVSEGPPGVTVFTLNAEEIRRSPGSFSDISRVLRVLPSMAQVSDNVADLVVRGGSPAENAFYVDNLLVPNINHYPVLGSSGGLMSMLNVDLIDAVNTSVGGFDVSFGDRISSVTEIRYRDGNPDEFDAQAELSMAGVGGVVEGPLPKSAGSYLLSARRSFLELIVDQIGTGVAPQYGDIQGKLSWQVASNHRFEGLCLWGASNYELARDKARSLGMTEYGSFDSRQGTFGITWRYLWPRFGFTETALAWSFSRGEYDLLRSQSGHVSAANEYEERTLRLRTSNTLTWSARHQLQFGLESENSLADYDYIFGSVSNGSGVVTPELNVSDRHEQWYHALFGSWTWSIGARLLGWIGSRFEYYDLNGANTLLPRGGVSYELTQGVSLNVTYGRFAQRVPAFIVSQAPAFRKLALMKAHHVVTGVCWSLSTDTKLRLEYYDKQYRDLPLSPQDPSTSVIDGAYTLETYRSYPRLVSSGRASSRGFELLLQRKSESHFNGLVAASASRTRYRDFRGVWRNRRFDNSYTLTLVGSYRPSSRWEFSCRWNLAGGLPYSPYDSALSEANGTGIPDRDRLMAERQPPYHTLHFQIDRRFLFRSSSLALSLSIVNVYNRANVAYYYWDDTTNSTSTFHQLRFIPLVGVEYEF